ncbi:MAG: DUF3881 family protein [Lachnospiraceae bacterium]|nr:DUF3881 family protein [Lachnospiraceae bacterium]
MHSFLKTVGFRTVTSRKDVEQLVKLVIEQGAEQYMATTGEKTLFAEILLEVAENVGVALRGEYDEQGNFHMEHYFPYVKGTNTSSKESVFISKRVDTDAYTGMCDDYRLGVSLIFYLQNVTDYVSQGYPEERREHPISLAALASEGKILLPTVSMKGAPIQETVDPSGRTKLMEAARKGDREAMEALTIDDIDLYAQISKRLKSEDIYSIVETTFIPYGSESDNYTILAMIESVKECTNYITGEELYLMDLKCNEVCFPVCINKKDLYGEPKVGRRFRGNIWMQGTVDFER